MSIKEIYNFIRWRSIGVRKIEMIANVSFKTFAKKKKSILDSTERINQLGFINGPTIDFGAIKSIKDKYENRKESVVFRERGAPFENLFRDEDIAATDPVLQLAFSKTILDPALDYFGGKASLDSIQVLYSYPTKGKLRESQMWHKDFGDSKSFHAIVYLNDVLENTDGPFVFVDRVQSKKIKKSLFIRRIDDETFKKELNSNHVETFYGKAGSSVFVDPAVCYHYGSRCEKGRLALFFTFNTITPYMIIENAITRNKEKLLEVAMNLRPDLAKEQLTMLLNL